MPYNKIEESIKRLKKMKRFDNYLKEQLKDEEFKREWNILQPELEVMKAIVDARTSMNLTQKQLSELTGIDQADISKLENGTRNPSIRLLQKLAEGMGKRLEIRFIDK